MRTKPDPNPTTINTDQRLTQDNAKPLPQVETKGHGWFPCPFDL